MTRPDGRDMRFGIFDTSIYLVPRAEALGFINFIIEIHFWMPIIIIAILTFIVSNTDKMIKWKEKNSENK